MLNIILHWIVRSLVPSNAIRAFDVDLVGTICLYSKIRKYVHSSMNNNPHTRAGEVS